MKLKPFIVSALVGAGAVLLSQKKDQIRSYFSETTSDIKNAKSAVDHVKQHLAEVQQEQANFKQVSQDLTYKFRVFNQEIQAHLNEIKAVTAKYQATDEESN